MPFWEIGQAIGFGVKAVGGHRSTSAITWLLAQNERQTFDQ